MGRVTAVLALAAAGSAAFAGSAIAAPSSSISDTVHAPNTGTTCSGQATVSGIPRRSVVDLLDDQWRADSIATGATLITQGDLPAVTLPINPIPLTFPGSPVTASVSLQDVTNAEAVSNAPDSVGAQDVPGSTSPGTFTSATLQDCAPRPQSLYPGTGGGPPLQWASRTANDANDAQTRDGVLFTFSQPIRSFGAWFGDLETRIDPDPGDALTEGTPARLKLLDVDGNVLLNREIGSDFRLEPDGPDPDTEPDRIAIDQSICGGLTTSDSHEGCGNQATRWLGFTSDSPEVAAMLVVVGDDDDSADPGGFEGLTEFISFIGPTIAESEGDLQLTKRVDRTSASPGDPMNYTVRVSNPGDRDEDGVQVVDELPPGLANISASDGGVVSGSQVAWPTIMIPARGSVDLTVTGTVAPGASGEVVNVALATSPTEGLLESETRTTLSSSPPESAGAPPASTPAAVTPAPPTAEAEAQENAASAPRGTKLALTKRGPARAKGGKTGLYRITVRNRGKAAAENVIVADALPAGAPLAQRPFEVRRARQDLARAKRQASLAQSGAGQESSARQLRAAQIRLSRAKSNARARLSVSNGLASWRIGTLPPGGSRTLTLRVRFTGDRNRVVGNRAIARADNSARATDVARTRVSAAPITTPAVTG